MTPEVLRKLEEAFAMGCTDVEACFYAGITKSPFYEYQDAHPEFKERKEQLKENPVLLARKNVQDALTDGDKDMTKWYLERKRKAEFSTKSEISADVSVNVVGEILKDIDGRTAGLPTDTE
jgi:hypothetical protein